MSETPITQDALDRLESNLRAAVREALDAAQQLIQANDKRYEQRFGDATTAVNAALQAAEKAVSKAEMASDKRFESVNEFRNALTDQQRTFMPRLEAEQRFAAAEKIISELREVNAGTGGERVGSKETWSWIVGIVGITLAIISFLVTRFPR